MCPLSIGASVESRGTLSGIGMRTWFLTLVENSVAGRGLLAALTGESSGQWWWSSDGQVVKWSGESIGQEWLDLKQSAGVLSYVTLADAPPAQPQ